MTYQQINEAIEDCYKRLSELKRMKEEVDDNPFNSKYLKLIDESGTSIFYIKKVHRDVFNHFSALTGVQMYIEGIAEFQDKAYLTVQQLAGKEIQTITRGEFEQLFDLGLENIQNVEY